MASPPSPDADRSMMSAMRRPGTNPRCRGLCVSGVPQVRPASRSVLAGGDADWTLSLVGPVTHTGSVADNGDGTYTLRFPSFQERTEESQLIKTVGIFDFIILAKAYSVFTETELTPLMEFTDGRIFLVRDSAALKFSNT